MDSLGGPIGGAWTSAEGGSRGRGALGLLKRRPLSSRVGGREAPMAIAVSERCPARVPSSSEGLRPTMEPWPTRGKAGWSVELRAEGLGALESLSRSRISLAPRLSTTSPVPSPRSRSLRSLRPRGRGGTSEKATTGCPVPVSPPGGRLQACLVSHPSLWQGLTRKWPSHHVQKLGTTAACVHDAPQSTRPELWAGHCRRERSLVHGPQSILEGPLFSAVTDHREGGCSASCPIRCSRAVICSGLCS